MLVFDPADPSVRDDPYPLYAELREREPAHWSPRVRAWILTRHDDVAAALRDVRLTADHAAAARYKGRPADPVAGSLRTVARAASDRVRLSRAGTAGVDRS